MSASSPAPVLADSALNQWLASMGLAVEYVRAEGNTLYYRDENGREVPVLDLACGFGSLLFGHNNDEIVEHAKSVLDARVPFHAQLSVLPHVNAVASEINRIIRRETGTDQYYSAIFANTGAEANEICMKHAELERRGRVSELRAEIDEHVAAVRAAAGGGRLSVAEGPHVPTGAHQDVASLLTAVEQENAERLANARPVFLALENAFHGKLVGSIQLTQNAQWRTPFTALAATVRFVPADQPDDLAKIIEEERRTLLDVVVDGDVVRVVARDLPTIAGFFVEPVRGGAGMKPVTPEFAREIQNACAAIGCPVIVDEVQSGFGRTGTFLGSSHMGLRGDYYTFAKIIAGGVTKNSVALVRQDRFRPEFEVIHSSTFAKDGFSGAIALKVLEMLEADGGRAYRMVRERGERLAGALNAVRADFPDVIKEVWGIGLMLSVEVADQSDAASERIREAAQSGTFGYLLSAFLLREHHIRALPAGPGTRFLRVSPSIYITDDEIARTEAALRSLCSALRDQDDQRLLPS
ncbi:4-aminobutyrate aminotransferase [Streptoalloteichus tenebrarius]|uniref:4-aminobutyrate aminotransferase n=1 Tax=Streptoalloteichus tenebrarius (strain ATCC 17920 / DSM 40477 / JCM 4838 / CBS 697.72 / NBRC 16177 / NCIMB 11028 / NRRL B-12390 / A12253. 1 / ISP 5477) TaxID=1933 RepID=A0ABT1HLJ8_STRSD|nr:aminotransferase class III-fold pyridoxal phosphate-dependent enzyme [Streptoalloteichus tenebrarius]MCP2256385.1 4-aminobutyrate aminotransferase [Streptoalloteichus tenebrarius]BFF04730.1 aminotransferase class III-fold pyridoxal phosphate-dependent enzyme [Streptoalloteichus tenebrarius]